ncbi:MAG: hypothetical protein F9K29_03670 [Hyphomicrobiaceae bacterium]|nr:MAG: hypothetical protein F9K29_03670 [Hyphomicrobiaceae bacterium]
MNTATQRAIEVALHFGVTEATVWQWSKLRGFPINAKRKVGQRVYWDLDQIKTWHAGRRSSQRRSLRDKLSTYEQMIA